MTGHRSKVDGLKVLDYDFDREFLESVQGATQPMVRVYPFERRAIVAGRGSDLKKEVNLSRARADNIPIYRRMGGGCSVFLDPGNLIVSIGFPAKGLFGVQSLFNQCSDWLIQAFKTMGLGTIYQDGISDLVMEDYKIGGSCFYRAQGLGYYSAAILVSPDLDAMDTYLGHPPREPAYRRGRPHKDFLSGLNVFVPGIKVSDLARHLETFLTPATLGLAA